MKILNVNNFQPNWPDAESISRSFEALGVEVDRICETKVSPSGLLAKVKRGKYDFVLVEEARLDKDYIDKPVEEVDQILGGMAEVMKEVPVVPWLTNIMFGIMRREPHLKLNPIFKADIVFSTDGGHDKEFKEYGINHYTLRQGIYHPEAVRGEPVFDTKARIGFIGAVYSWMWPYREKMVRFLQNTYGSDFGHFGQDGMIRHQRLNNLIATLDIVVGDSVYSPNYWSNRIYEMIGRGAFLIHPYIEGIEKEFEPYKHFIPYNYGDFDGLKKKIDYYLDHPEKRRKISDAGMKHCIKYHTYKHRCEELIKVLKNKKIV